MFVLILPQAKPVGWSNTLKNQLRPLSEVANSVQAFDWSGGKCRGKETETTQGHSFTVRDGEGDHDVQGVKLSEPKAPARVQGGGQSCCSLPMFSDMA